MLRRKRLRDLTDEEVRLAIGQQMGLHFLIPLAIERLKCDVLASGDMYEGALLKVVLSAAAILDGVTNEQAGVLEGLIQQFEHLATELDEPWRGECLPGIVQEIQRFRERSTLKL